MALKNADLILKTFGPAPGQLKLPPGHEEIEIGLVKLFRTTGERKYLDLAKFFIDQRGNAAGHKLYGTYAQDHKPVIEQDEAVGHAVRAAYLYSGMVDVAALTGETRYMAALDKIWDDVVTKKLYLTGGIGAAGGIEGFGPAYDLPNPSGYAETCATIALRPVELADVPLSRRREVHGPLRAGRVQRLPLGRGDERRPLLLSQSARLARPARAHALVHLRLLSAERRPLHRRDGRIHVRRRGR